ncbi:hypothetical protein GCM10008910_29720 [Faecalicatena orotica]|uniref:Uncharacterized protein n=1 Tax=Faecalicatena orotica TaxID=1544 RepID=A0A2Y9BFI9_9FIRM|nr:hypothetical protein [Faecalicatena orotica]PWJ29083.1 hypothetical protein A8806_107232 [Faecalicatena orotica]SSA56253.1 hypothetical protein SAMN05216536_107232 [Faecalicatena orotica]
MKSNVKMFSPCVGNWWYTDNGQVWGIYCSLNDAVLNGSYRQFSMSDNHMTLWRKVVEDYIENEEEQKHVYALGYDVYEHGSVVYDLRTQCFYIICSETIYNNLIARKAIKSAFGLNGCNIDFQRVSLT